jgi:predicted HAD superfamily Cof-like phosphohydrolase
MDVFEQQKTFMDACGQGKSEDTANLYFNLIYEEVKELSHAVEANDLVEQADALIDIIVVTIGMLHGMGLPARALWDEVMRSNFAKIGPDGKVQKNAMGKVIKPEGWTPPDLASIITCGS